MQIQFKQPDGRIFKADLTSNSRLTNITELESNNSSSSPAGSGGSENGKPENSKPSDKTGTQPAKDNESESQEKQGGEGSEPNPPLSKSDAVFVQQLKSVLINNRARKQRRNKQKGLVDPRAFTKTQTDHTSVFRQNNRKDSQRNYSVVLLVDESGSMYGPKAMLAQELAGSISSSLDSIDGVENAVLGFSGNRMIEHKRFDNKGFNTTNIIEDCVSNHRTPMGQKINAVEYSNGENADLIAMEYALHYLRENSARNSKMIFVMLSDGEPCPSRPTIDIVTSSMLKETFESKIIPELTEPSSSIKPMHKLIRKNPDINSFGLGMLMGGQQVPNHKVVKNLADTKTELLRFLRQAIN